MTIKPEELKFVPLHSHTTFSIFDAIGFPAEHMDFAYSNGLDAMAITDHGNMSAMSYQALHSKKMKAEGKNFKPIYGIEAYFIEDHKEWREQYETWKSEKKKVNDEENSLVVEDEGETKSVNDSLIKKRSHLVLLAMNQKGLNNLFSLVSKSYQEGNFYRYPRMDLKMLEEHNEGIIALSACMGGIFGKTYWQYREQGDAVVLEKMAELSQKFQNIFGDRFYAELQWNKIPEQHIINQLVIETAKRTNLNFVSTCDSHYPSPDKWKDREIYKRLGWLNNKPDYAEDSLPKSKDELKCELYPKNAQQMWEEYKKTSALNNSVYDDELVAGSFMNTYNIAHDRIETFYPDTTVKLPKFVVPEGKTANETLANMCVEEMKKRGLMKDKVYLERLSKELIVIKQRDFANYFLTMKYISDFARDRYLCGLGRGSGAGSLICYLLNITQADPIKYGLQFERFITATGDGYPDVDFDCSQAAELKEKLKEALGKDNVVSITNFNTLQFRSLIKDVSKFYGVPFTEVNDVTSKMLNEATPLAKAKHGIKAGVYAPTYEELLEFSSSLQKYFDKYPNIKSSVEGLLGQIRSISTHAGGAIVADNISHLMPLINSGGVIQTPWAEGQNVRHLEPFGFIKFDLLGLSTLEMIEDCIRRILKDQTGQEPTIEQILKYYDDNLHPDKLDLNDQKVYKTVFKEGKFAGVFQFTETRAQNFCKSVAPKNITDISAITSIYRPGPLSANVHEDYLKAKLDPSSVVYLHPAIKEVAGETYGFLVFQEQIAMLAHKLGKDISLDEGNMLRKLLTKKGTGKGFEKKDAIHSKFIAGCTEKGLSDKEGQRIWETFEFFSGYGFNLSHAVCYSILSYQCAYLLTYHTENWLSAFLDKEDKKREQAINIVKSFGYEIMSPDVNFSDGLHWDYNRDLKVFVQPLNSIKGLGDKAIEQIMNNRPFEVVEDLIYNNNIVYSKLNKKALDVLLRGQALKNMINKDSRFSGDKHAWNCIIESKPKKQEDFSLVVDRFYEEGNFTSKERVEFMTELTGMFPFSEVMSTKTYKALERAQIPPVGEYDPELEICWFVPREVIEKKTAKGKPYVVIKVIDDGGKQFDVRCWTYNPEKDQIETNKVYIAKLTYDENWGFSVRVIGKNFKML